MFSNLRTCAPPTSDDAYLSVLAFCGQAFNMPLEQSGEAGPTFLNQAALDRLDLRRRSQNHEAPERQQTIRGYDSKHKALRTTNPAVDFSFIIMFNLLPWNCISLSNRRSSFQSLVELCAIGSRIWNTGNLPPSLLLEFRQHVSTPPRKNTAAGPKKNHRTTDCVTCPHQASKPIRRFKHAHKAGVSFSKACCFSSHHLRILYIVWK